MEQERIHRLGSSVCPGSFVDEGQFIFRLERRFNCGSFDARRPFARTTVGQSFRNILLPLPGPAQSAHSLGRL